VSEIAGFFIVPPREGFVTIGGSGGILSRRCHHGSWTPEWFVTIGGSGGISMLLGLLFWGLVVWQIV